jgi:HEAT repeat protein
MSAGSLVHVRTQVGGSWRDTDARVTDLGAVSPREASAYLFGMAEQLDGISEKGRTLMPAVIAADAPVLEPLRAIARNEHHTVYLRRQAVQWLGLAGDASVIPDLVRYASGGDAGEKKSLSNSAIAALAALEDDAGIPSLIELSRDKSSSVRHDVVFWLGQTDDPRAIRRLRQVIDDRNEENRVRKNAIFALGQCEAAPTKDLVTIYNTIEESSLREQAIFALSQRDERAATDALISIAKEDSDRRMRGKALFWLAQKKDPRVAKLISDILVK